MTDLFLGRVLLLVALLATTAGLTAAEAAYFSLGRARLARGAATGDGALISRPHDLLVTLLVGITVANLLASAVVASIGHGWIGGRWTVLLESAFTVLVVATLGEILPMAVALRHPEAVLRVVRHPVLVLMLVVAPVRVALHALTVGAMRLVERRRPGPARALGDAELRTLVDAGVRAGAVAGSEGELIRRTLALEHTTVRSLMVPRPDMHGLDVATPAADILPILARYHHSRVPVFDGSLDNIVGVLHTKGLVQHLDGLPPGFDVSSALVPPFVVPESKRADALLEEFLARRLQFAVVVDEHGSTAGLVTLEDVLEELVGELADEDDVPEPLVERLGPGVWRVAGKLGLEAFAGATGLEVERGDYDTVAGWVLHAVGHIPRPGDSVALPAGGVATSRAGGATAGMVTVERMARTRIVSVRVELTPLPPAEASGEPA